LLKALDHNSFERGKAIYRGLCVNCHGQDGRTPQLEVARAFGVSAFKYGADPYSMFVTITYGAGQMPSQAWMTPQERYDVIHYIRQQFMKPMRHPQYRPIDKAYLKALPVYAGPPPGEQLAQGERDFGPALASQLGREIESALSIRLAEKTTLSYDLHTMDSAGAWRGGFLDLSRTQRYQLRGEGEPTPKGETWQGMQTWGWGHDGTLDYPRGDLPPRGPMPNPWLDYHGHYLYGDRVILSYAIDGREVLEMPLKTPGFEGLSHVLSIKPGDQPLILCVAKYEGEGPTTRGVVQQDYITTPQPVAGGANESIVVAGKVVAGKLARFVAAAARGDVEGMTWRADNQNRLVLHIPPSQNARKIEIVQYADSGADKLEYLAGLLQLHALRRDVVPDISLMTRGGAPRWGKTIETIGKPGDALGAYALDTITLPDQTPWNTWFRTAALDFMSDGRLVVSTYGGDIWIVSGVDLTLRKLVWKRFASGLYEPFGVKVVHDVIYVTCKDRITRLHDFNGDGEADFYESFFADPDMSVFFHAFNFDLQTDEQGNFYYAKAGQYTDFRLPGAIVRVSPDGRRHEFVCTGFRTPNGMGVMPDGRFTVSDNQGNWMPASKISVVREGGFYGYSQTHIGASRYGTTWAPDGGRIDHTKVRPPDTFDPPMIWMPQELDNSSGGQVTADATRWGPLSGRLLHTSFGKGWMYYLLTQDMDDVTQAAIVRLPYQFNTGIMRARVNPVDGQVYAIGLSGWQGPPGGDEGGIQRLRYTGKPMHVLTGFAVVPRGIELSFNFQLDPASAARRDRYEAEQWNYHWTANYGSAHYSVRHPEKEGHDKVNIEKVVILPGRHAVRLVIPDLQPVHQMRIDLKLRDAQGGAMRERVYLTIHRVPEGRPSTDVAQHRR